MRLPDGEVHLWGIRPRDVAGAVLLARCRCVLDPEERRRHGRFLREEDRHLFLVAHAALRDILGRYLACAPEDVAFRTEPAGRPVLAEPSDPTLLFNLSHTRGFVLLAVGRAERLGADVERVERNADADGIADRFFAPPEAAALRSLPPSARGPRFIETWVLKEVFVKALGEGLPHGLQSFAFDWSTNAEPTPEPVRDRGHAEEHTQETVSQATAAASPNLYYLDSPPENDAPRWRFRLYVPESGYRAAVGARLSSGAGAPRFRVFETIPFGPAREARWNRPPGSAFAPLRDSFGS